MRDRFPRAHLEILGVKSIVALAEKRFYADGVRSLDSGALARFFARNADLPAEFSDYFASFDLILSYLYDPDRIFEENVRRISPANFLTGPAKLDNSEHAALQLSRPLRSLDLPSLGPVAQLFPSDEDHAVIQHYRANAHRLVAFHPGSGSETKNWALENWIKLGDDLLANGYELLIVAGEADRERAETLKKSWRDKRVRFVENISLPQLAALLKGLVFVGHDSGISHIAAAAGARCLLLFGWTDPAIWAPANAAVTVIRAPEGKMSLLQVETVSYALMRIGIRT